MSTAARRRLISDVARLRTHPLEGLQFREVSSDCLMVFLARIEGPLDTDWEAGVFWLLVEFGEDFPSKPPQAKFIGEVPFHPNVYRGDRSHGEICATILQRDWSPLNEVGALLLSLRSLLSDPNPNSPANTYAARLLCDEPLEYRRRVLQCVEDSWCVDDSQLAEPINNALLKYIGRPFYSLIDQTELNMKRKGRKKVEEKALSPVKEEGKGDTESSGEDDERP